MFQYHLSHFQVITTLKKKSQKKIVGQGENAGKPIFPTLLKRKNIVLTLQISWQKQKILQANMVSFAQCFIHFQSLILFLL